jgi:branched-chain amino acid transport system ATP-binding protein
MTILQVEEVKKNFKGLAALTQVNFGIVRGEILGLIGPNGSGKTTLFNIITGFLDPTGGQVLFKGERITGLKPNQIARLGIGRVFQHSSLFPNLSVKENLMVARHLKTRNHVFGAFVKTKGYREEERNIDQKAMELLAFVGLQARCDMLAGNLPYGEQRELELAMALAAEPELLLLDEPATGMNPEETVRLMSLIGLLRKDGLTLLVVEHNMRLVMGICTRIVAINFGVKIAEGTPQEIATNEEVISAYLGKGTYDAKG